MFYMNVFSFIIALIIFCRYVWIYFPFYFEIEKEIFTKKVFGISLWITTSGNRKTNYGSARRIFTIKIRDESKITAAYWESRDNIQLEDDDCVDYTSDEYWESRDNIQSEDDDCDNYTSDLYNSDKVYREGDSYD